MYLQIDQMRNVLAEYARGNTQSVQMLARAHDMRYQAKVWIMIFKILLH